MHVPSREVLLQVRDALKALEGLTETARLDVMQPLEVTHPCSEPHSNRGSFNSREQDAYAG